MEKWAILRDEFAANTVKGIMNTADLFQSAEWNLSLYIYLATFCPDRSLIFTTSSDILYTYSNNLI